MNPTASETDRIEREVVIRAPRSRVWRALTDPAEFGAWFRVNIETKAFVPGATAEGTVTYPGYEHLRWKIIVDRVEPETRFSWFWHPYGIDPNVDYSSEEPTLVEFTLEEIAEGTRLKVVESGFDRVPQARRAQAYRMNGEGWTIQVQSIARYVTEGH